MKIEIRLCGTGGQGLILAGIILAEAAILNDLNALQSQSYGPEARGGASKAEVIISDQDIFFPKVTKPNMLLALSQKAYEKYIGDMDPDSILIIDEGIQIDKTKVVKEIYKLRILNTASEDLGKGMVANIVALGVLDKLIPEIGSENILQAILGRVPKGTEELNKAAFQAGGRLVK